MGGSYRFTCNNCDYTAYVSGGRDAGMMYVVQTMVCRTCKNLTDVEIGPFGPNWRTMRTKSDGIELKCGECNGSDLFRWRKGTPCPKCGGTLQEGELVELWD